MTAVLSSDLSAILAHAANGQKAAGEAGNLSDILAAVWIERLKLLDAQIAETRSSIMDKNAYIDNLNVALRELRINRPKGPAGMVNVGKLTAVGRDGKIFKVVNYIDDGLFPGAVGEDVWNQTQVDKAIEWLNAKLNLLKEQSHIEMIRLQSLMETKERSFKDHTNMMNMMTKSVNSAMFNR